MVCCLAALGYNSKVSIEKEKIEVDAQSNFNQNTIKMDNFLLLYITITIVH